MHVGGGISAFVVFTYMGTWGVCVHLRDLRRVNYIYEYVWYACVHLCIVCTLWEMCGHVHTCIGVCRVITHVCTFGFNICSGRVLLFPTI